MKEIITIIIFYLSAVSCLKEKRYCGEIIDKGYDSPASGYKTHTDRCYFFIMKVDSINACIRIDVTIPTWYNRAIGDHACYILNKQDLYDYGNGRKHLIK